MVEIREAKLEDSVKIAQLYDEVYEGKYPLLEFLEAHSIEKMIADGHIWVLAVDNNEVIGSAVGIPEKWNNSFEFGRGAINKNYWDKGVGTEISKSVVKRGFEQGFDVMWGTPRNIPVYKVVKGLGMVLTGYLPGAHKVDFREMHLLSILLSEKAKKNRVAPPGNRQNKIYNLPAVKRVIKELCLENVECEYPDDFVIGPESKNMLNAGFDYRPGDNSLIINSIDNPTVLNSGYFEATVPASNIKAIEFFEKLNFKICAFLPAWYGTGKRYDCVRMANCFEKQLIADKSVESIVNQICGEFGN